MGDGAPLAGVDALAGQHGVAVRLHAAFARQLGQQLLRRLVEQLLGQIGQQRRRFEAEAFKAPRVLREGLAQVERPRPGKTLAKVRHQPGPDRRLVATRTLLPIHGEKARGAQKE